MDLDYIKHEVIEEDFNELFSNDYKQYDENSASQSGQLENKFELNKELSELSNYEYSSSKLHIAECDSAINICENINNTIKQEDTLQDENVYVDGEPEISIEKFSGLLKNNTKVIEKDPLDIPIPSFQQPSIRPRVKQIQKVILLRKSSTVNEQTKTDTRNKMTPKEITIKVVMDTKSIQNLKKEQYFKNVFPSKNPSTSASKKRLIPIKIKKVMPVRALGNKTYSKNKTTSIASTSYDLKTYKCDICCETFTNKSQHIEHSLKCNVRCNYCHQPFKVNTLRLIHEKMCKMCPKETAILGSQEKVIITEHLPCNALKKPRELKREHIWKDKNGFVSCNICNAKFTTLVELFEHDKNNHLTPNAYACHLCDKKFDLETTAIQHLKRHH